MVKMSSPEPAGQAGGGRARPNVHRGLGGTALAGDVAARLLAFRAETGLTQARVAARAGTHQAVIGRLEGAHHSPTLATLLMLARGLGLEFRVLVTPDGRVELL